ncbi:MAG: thiamine pyrophosphate-binding protein [Alphaproteobacteria bacterium]|nr:thiamine pyrophosphate-binding protein [Alphaproteobacteria bacterium]
MKASDFIVDFFIQKNISKIFGYIGGMVAHLTDSIYQSDYIEMVNTITEQGAGFAAEGYSRVTGKVSVAIATSGPGATNLLTPMASCYFDSTPVVFITGQVNTFEYKKFPEIRQTGFQETDIVSMAKPITKYAVLIDDIKNLRYELEKAFFIAQDGRKGPVLIDIPMDIQRIDFDFSKARSFYAPCVPQNEIDLKNIIDIINSSKSPIILVGNGVRLSSAQQYLRDFLDKTQIPVVESLLGLDCVPSEYIYNLGMIGTYGNRYANIALSIADTILVLGSRLDIRQIGANTSIFNNKKIIHVDIDEGQLKCSNLNKITVNLSIDSFFQQLCQKELNINITNWQSKVLQLKKKYPSTEDLDGNKNLPNIIIKKISEKLNNDDVVCSDVGQHQMWVGQSLVVKEHSRHLSSGGLGCMGFALPAAIGASISGARSIVISGDGGFQMNIQELEIIKRRNLPIKIVIMNNFSLGMVRQFQDLYFEGRNASTVHDYSAPDFSLVANAYKINGITVRAEDLTDDMINDFLESNDHVLINIIFEQSTQITPKVLFGNTIDKMHPLISDEELEQIKKEEL